MHQRKLIERHQGSIEGTEKVEKNENGDRPEAPEKNRSKDLCLGLVKGRHVVEYEGCKKYYGPAQPK